MEKAKKTEIMQKFARKEGDVGSPEVQIAVLTEKIAELTEHMRANTAAGVWSDPCGTSRYG